MAFSSAHNRLLVACRFLAIQLVAFVIAMQASRGIYQAYHQQSLLRLHTADLKTVASNMTIKLAYFLERDPALIQSILDASFGLFGFVITDCRTEAKECGGQRIRYMSSKDLGWYALPTEANLAHEPFAVLRRLPDLAQGAPHDAGILGRLYVVKNIPHSFGEDYRLWLASPFSDVGARNYYLRTAGAFMTGGVLVWLILESFLLLRRSQLAQVRQREQEIVRRADTYLQQLTDKNRRIAELDAVTSRQFSRYQKRIRELEQKMAANAEYASLAEEVLLEMEQSQKEQSDLFQKELEQNRSEIERLRGKVGELEKASEGQKEVIYKALEAAVTPQFSNAFEKQIYEMLAASARFQSGEWRLLKNFDVAVGRNYRQFTDFILVSRDSLVILEAKYYLGTISSEGDYLNDVWFSVNPSGRKQIDCMWGENPFHQINEYCMSLMKLLKQRSPWQIQVYGLLVFPDEANLEKLPEHLGRFYRVTSLSRLIATIDKVQSEAGRQHLNQKRPQPEQVERMLRGRRVDGP